MLLAGISCGGGVEQHRPAYLIGRDWAQESKSFPSSHHGKWVPFPLYLHIGTETPSKQWDLLCFKMLIYIVLCINVLSNQSVIPRSICFALLCSALDKLDLNFVVEDSEVYRIEFHHIL